MARHRRRVKTSKRKSTGTHTRRTRKTAPVAVIPVGATPLPRRRIVGGNRRGGYRLPTGMEMQTGGFNIKKIPIIGPIIGGIASLFK